MKKIIAFILITTLTPIFSYSIANPPVKITWENLRDVTFKKKWNKEEGMFILEPLFGTKVTSLKGQEVTLTGYMIPVDVDANYYGQIGHMGYFRPQTGATLWPQMLHWLGQHGLAPSQPA